MLKIFCIFSVAGLLITSPVSACDELEVTVSGQLSKSSSAVENDLRVDVSDIGAHDTELKIRFALIDEKKLEIQIKNDVLNSEDSFGKRFEGPLLQVLFDSIREQEGVAYITLFPATNSEKPIDSTIKLLFHKLRLTDGPTDLLTIIEVRKNVECIKVPAITSVKSSPDSVRDELNPIIGEAALQAYLGTSQTQ